MYNGKVFESLGSVSFVRMHAHKLVQPVIQSAKACVCNVWDCKYMVHARECGFS